MGNQERREGLIFQLTYGQLKVINTCRLLHRALLTMFGQLLIKKQKGELNSRVLFYYHC